ncbi:MAG: hypothetical protein GX811_05475, partial [Lentisphaerae bacterium]|nr:hypothetical protein [Lentisphaerota bacterium]
FMQWQDVTQTLYHENATGDELADALIASYDNEEEIFISNPLLNQYCEWRSRPVETESGQKIRKALFSSPRILLNTDGMGIYLRLPQQKIQSEFPVPKVNWHIRSDEFQTSESCSVFASQIDNHAYSEESIVVLKPARQYNVDLFNSDDYQKPMSSWTLDMLKRPYMAFTMNGDLIKGESLYGNQSILVLPDRYSLRASCQISELSRIPYWARYQVLSLAYQPSDTISIYERETGNKVDELHISSSVKPELIRGQLLFNNTGIYTSLPYIKIPDYNNYPWKATLITAMERISILLDDIKTNEVPLHNWISSTDYGAYELRIQNNKGNRYQIRFYYVPNIIVTNDAGHWPKPISGYESNQIQIIMPEYIEINLDHYDIEANLVHDQERRMVFSGVNSVTSVNGLIKINSSRNPIVISFRLAIRPLLWSIFGVSNKGQVQMMDTVIRYDWNSLSNSEELFLIISTGDLGAPSLESRLTAQRPNGEILMDKEIQIKSWSQTKFGLSDLIFSPELIDSHRLTVALTLMSPDQSITENFPILIISERLKIIQFRKHEEEGFIHFEWRESG